ncbi:hypothetical protein [Streptomyces sp. NPDC047130]|uniref:hypothetical protein n=1 Tax=Streptomyces sp. NPDC047130 TaxID=3155261 RepID=UPI0034049616
MMDWLEKNEFKNDAESIKSLDEARDVGANNATAPVREYMEQHGMTERDRRAAAKDMEGAYNDGRSLADTDNVDK